MFVLPNTQKEIIWSCEECAPIIFPKPSLLREGMLFGFRSHYMHTGCNYFLDSYIGGTSAVINNNIYSINSLITLYLSFHLYQWKRKQKLPTRNILCYGTTEREKISLTDCTRNWVLLRPIISCFQWTFLGPSKIKMTWKTSFKRSK